MCQMTATGTRWKREIELPDFGESATYWALRYGDETRYTRLPLDDWDGSIRKWLKPMYAVRVRSRLIFAEPPPNPRVVNARG